MCDTCQWEDALERARSMEQRGSYVATDLMEWIDDHEHVTPRQLHALDKLERTWKEKDRTW